MNTLFFRVISNLNKALGMCLCVCVSVQRPHKSLATNKSIGSLRFQDIPSPQRSMCSIIKMLYVQLDIAIAIDRVES